MRKVLLASMLLSLWSCPAEDELPRNPFWPQDFEGERHPITIEPRFKPKPKELPVRKPAADRLRAAAPTNRVSAAQAALAAAEQKRQLEEKLWAEARRTLNFGSAFSFNSGKQSTTAVTINGRSYVVGDLVSKNVGDNRFTWSVESVSADGKLKLKRLKYRSLKTNENEKK